MLNPSTQGTYKRDTYLEVVSIMIIIVITIIVFVVVMMMMM